MMRLKSILNGLKYTTPDQIGELEVKNVVSDSRLVEERDLFVAIKGTSRDGHRYIKEALDRGAAAVILERDVDVDGAIKIRVKDARKASALAAANLRGNPSRDIKVIGVTGTNGKTTVTYILENILRRAGFKVGVVGTVRYKIGDEIIESDNTTPSPIMLQDMLRRMADNSLDYCVMEVSSHALDQHRTGGVGFRAAIFTNATQEHLDYHKNFKNYLNSKTALFKNLPRESVAIINRDDPSFSKVKRSASAGRSISFGLNSKADLYGDNIKVDINGSTFDMHAEGGSVSVRSPLIGIYNISNMLAAASCALAEGVDIGTVKEGLENIDGIPGRLQVQDAGGIKVFIDYAHTDDALEKVLKAISGLKRRRLITVFGCGGNRDKKKRPKMGAIAAKFSDYVVITSDNPRYEDPVDIMNDITRGIPANIKDYSVIEERREAIIKALSHARDGDIVLIAGKGHEKYQIIKDEKLPFSDLEVVKEFAKKYRECLT
jgi:UDP-N-acetylmuramoyl-L-alanyl-D-glutamate--2,6-diaminopimelate ligase